MAQGLCGYFPYEETDDQLNAISECRGRHGKPRPMDRLLCGDVGYGKTEVALRAAFKAVTDGYQGCVSCTYDNSCKSAALQHVLSENEGLSRKN